MLKLFTKAVRHSSLSRAIIYTIGHIIIAMSIVSYFTDASFLEAGAVALVEPAINGFWYYILDKIYITVRKK